MRLRAGLMPFRVSVVRGLLEGLSLWLLLELPGVAARFALSNDPAIIASQVGWLLLVVWPAWRIRQVPARWWWLRATFGLLRFAAIGLLLGGIGTAATSGPLLLGPVSARDAAVVIPLQLVPIVLLRAVLAVIASAGRRVRTRLRLQLMVSHVTVLAVLFVGATAVGSVVLATVVLTSRQPPASQAFALARVMDGATGRSSLDPGAARLVLRSVIKGRTLMPRQSSTVVGILFSTTMYARLLVLDRSGHIVAAAINRASQGRCASIDAYRPLPTAIVSSLRSVLTTEKSVSVPVPRTQRCSNGSADQQYVAAPIRSQSGAVVGMAVAQAGTFVITPPLFAGIAVTLFSAATLALALIAVVPVVLLSAVTGLAFARGTTDRLDAMARAAHDLAGGDLSRRVAVDSHNEIASLAIDFNRMASHLEGAVQELRQARAAAEAALRDRQELVASVSHDLRTPIAIVQAHLENLNLEGVTGTRTRPVTIGTVEALRREMLRLATLVDDMVALTGAGPEYPPVHCAQVDVGALLRSMGALLRPLAQREGGLSLVVTLDANLPPAHADAQRLRQVLANLVRNAVRHTPPGGTITLSASREDSWVVIAVADSGEGIPLEHLPHIFERFYRVDRARTRAGGGAGLGLAIVREFTELMEGRVTVESTVGVGSCFRLFLHAARHVEGMAAMPAIAERSMPDRDRAEWPASTVTVPIEPRLAPRIEHGG